METETEEKEQSIEELFGSYPEIGEVKEQLMKEREEFRMREFNIEDTD